MIRAFWDIGRSFLAQGNSFLEALIMNVPENTGGRNPIETYIVVLKYVSEQKELYVELRPVNEGNLKKVLWIGNARGNNPQDRLTTDNLEYLVSHSLPNLYGRLKGGEIKEKLKKFIEAHIINEAAIPLWNLPSLGIDIDGIIEKWSKAERNKFGKLIQSWDILKGKNLTFTPELIKDWIKASNKKENVVKFVKQILLTWILNETGLNKKQIVLFNFTIDNGKLLSESEEYKRHLEKLFIKESFEDKKLTYEGICHLCGKRDILSGNFKKFTALKFYIVDKPGFAPKLIEKNYTHHFAVCKECYMFLKAGDALVQSKFQSQFAGEKVWLIPQWLRSDSMLQVSIEDLSEYVKGKFSATETIEGWRNFQRELGRFRRYGNIDDMFSLTFLFVRTSNNAVKVLKEIQEVPPSKLDELVKVSTEIYKQTETLIGENLELGLNSQWLLFPIRKTQGENKDVRIFLDYLEALLLERPISFLNLLPLFLRVARIHIYEHYETYIQNEYKQPELGMTEAILKSNFLYIYLKKLGSLKDPFEGGVSMEIIRELPEEIGKYVEELDLDNYRVGLFLLGVLIGEIGVAQYKQTNSKPILNKINFLGMDGEKVRRLSNEVLDKARQYKVLDANTELIFSLMKEAFDRGGEVNLPAYENTYWILSGYAFVTRRALTSKHGNDNKEEKEV